jgi:hypothetical protein
MRRDQTIKGFPRNSPTVLAVLFTAGISTACSSSTAPIFTQWEGDLSPIPPATVSGRAAAVTQFGRTQLSVQIQEAEPEVIYGWRVDSGTCENAGAIQGGEAAYPPLAAGAGGTASSEAILPVEFRASGQFSVRVFLEVSEETVACGELLLQG